MRVAGLKQCGLLRRGVPGQFAQRRVIVEDEEAAPEARRDQVVLAALNLDIADGNRRHAGAELLPSRAAVEGHVHAELGRREHQAGALVVLHHAPHQMPFGDALGDAGPGAAAVARHQQIRREVPVFVVIQGHVHGVRVVQIGADVVDESGVGNARQRAHLDAPPALAAVLGDLDQAVVGAGVQQPFSKRGFGQRGDRVVVGHGEHIPGRVPAPGLTHKRHEHAVFVAGQIARDRRPLVAAVFRAPHALRGKVQPRGLVRRDQDRRVPVEALRRIAGRRLRLDVRRLAGDEIDPGQVAALPLGVHDVRVARLRGRLVAIAAEHHFPVGRANTVHVIGARRTALGVVVLRAAVNRVERLGVIHGQLVVLGDRQIGHIAPGGAQIVAFVNPAVAAHHDVIRVRGVEHDGVHIAVLAEARHGFEGFAAVCRFLHGGADEV